MGRQLILGYDASCGRCAHIAQGVLSAGGGALEVLPLSHPRVLAARKRAFGDRPPHQPTLIEYDNDASRAWIGPKLAVVVLRRLGLRRTIAVCAALGSVPEVPGGSGVLSRATFLKGVVGVGIGLASVLPVHVHGIRLDVHVQLLRSVRTGVRQRWDVCRMRRPVVSVVRGDQSVLYEVRMWMA